MLGGMNHPQPLIRACFALWPRGLALAVLTLSGLAWPGPDQIMLSGLAWPGPDQITLSSLVCPGLDPRALSLCGIASAENWPGWRGPRRDGVSQETQLPLRWSAE